MEVSSSNGFAPLPHLVSQVYQEYLIVPSLSVVPALARILRHCAESDPKYKVIVFFPTARFTGYMASLMGDVAGGGIGLNVLEIHSRKSQAARNKAAEAFRVGKGVFLFSSDVSARGMDFPDVTRVIQVRRRGCLLFCTSGVVAGRCIVRVTARVRVLCLCLVAWINGASVAIPRNNSIWRVYA